MLSKNLPIQKQPLTTNRTNRTSNMMNVSQVINWLDTAGWMKPEATNCQVFHSIEGHLKDRLSPSLVVTLLRTKSATTWTRRRNSRELSAGRDGNTTQISLTWPSFNFNKHNWDRFFMSKIIYNETDFKYRKATNESLKRTLKPEFLWTQN